MIQINSIVLLRIAVIAIIVVLQSTGAPVQTTTQAEVSFYDHFFPYMDVVLVVCVQHFFRKLCSKIHTHAIITEINRFNGNRSIKFHHHLQGISKMRQEFYEEILKKNKCSFCRNLSNFH